MVGMGGHSYISSDDLQSLDLSPSSTRINNLPPPLSQSPLSSPSLDYSEDTKSTLSTSTSTTQQRKRVAFCPLALLIQCAAEGEKDPALLQSTQLQQQKGRPRIAVRTYSLDTPNLTSATTRAWRSVCAGFNSSLQPLLTPSHSVRSPSPERERESTSFARSRSYSDPALRVPEMRGRQRKEEEEDVGFVPEGGEGRGLKIRLPGLTRRCCPSAALATSPPCKGILKPCSFGSTTTTTLEPTTNDEKDPRPSTPPLPLTLGAEPSSSSSTTIDDPYPPISILATHPSALTLPLSLSRSPSHTTSTSPPSQSSSSLAPPSSDSAPGPQIVPLAPCCPHCTAGAEYGRQCSEGEYVEKWSKSARRKRRRDSKAQEEREKMGGCPGALFGRVALGSGRRESEEEEGSGSGSDQDEQEGEGQGPNAATAAAAEGGLAGAVVDEVQVERKRRGEKDDLEVFAEEGSSEEELGGGVDHAEQEKKPEMKTTTALLTPPMSPESTFAHKNLSNAPATTTGTPPSPPSPPLSPSESAPSSSTPSSRASAPPPTAPTPTPPTPPTTTTSKRRFSLSLPSISAARVLSGAGRGIVEAGMVAGVGGAGGRWG
ncbi:hypothetical protein BCR35DRAFT_334462 [Leucosporidium creatinivorum]|uniref:Uncharacterized protein n=1 Tax=Leucosporidium creatinivorum TaxID=106004 RepID=A0A1Y2E8R4_9BASI|nr:hypothetical protein BCR35DRAFT_334462 [Leucosporidium creatinivorum]